MALAARLIGICWLMVALLLVLFTFYERGATAWEDEDAMDGSVAADVLWFAGVGTSALKASIVGAAALALGERMARKDRGKGA